MQYPSPSKCKITRMPVFHSHEQRIEALEKEVDTLTSTIRKYQYQFGDLPDHVKLGDMVKNGVCQGCQRSVGFVLGHGHGNGCQST